MESNSNNIENICKNIIKNYNEESVYSAFSLLIKLFNNIINNPNEPKFRQFKVTNEAIKSKILSIKGTDCIVKEVGYEQLDPEFLVYKNPKIDLLQKAVKVLDKYLIEVNEKISKNNHLKKNSNINKLNEEIKARQMEELKKKQEILKQIELDKQERAKKEKAYDSKANDLRFGATVKKFECSNPRGG